MHVEIFNKAEPGLDAALRPLLIAQCQQLGIVLTFSPNAAQAGERRIVLVFAQHGSKWSAAEESGFEAMLGQGVMVLPVVHDPPAAQGLPKAFSVFNAFVMSFFGSAWVECLVDEILSMVWLHRRTPKVFISYKRTDSGAIAAQLYDRLSHLGYETFFDEASVPRGADFQRELKWWLNDADLLVVLASPRFPLSTWCMEEVSFCQQRFVGVVLVQWPEAIYTGAQRIRFPDVDTGSARPVIIERTQPNQMLTLLPQEFAGDPPVQAGAADPNLPERELTDAGLSRVLKLCASQRTVGIRQRLDNLIPLAHSLLPGAIAVGGAFSPADLAYQDARGLAFVRVLPFRPRPEHIRQACIDGVQHGQVGGCFYAENDPLDPRAAALRWLTNAERKRDPMLSDGWIWASAGGKLWLP
jgi:hypothetical protein